METMTKAAPAAGAEEHPRAHYEGLVAQALAECADVRIPQLVALFKRCDERGQRTILALAGVQAGFVRSGS